MTDYKQKDAFRKTLASILPSLVDQRIVIDLRTEASISGIITHVSGYMDVTLENCIFRNPRGEYFPFDEFYIKSRNIRYIHIPQQFTAKQCISKYISSLEVVKKRREFKAKRAQLYQQEILQELSDKNKT